RFPHCRASGPPGQEVIPMLVRRQLLRLSLLSGTAALLQACAPTAPSAPTSPPPTAVAAAKPTTPLAAPAAAPTTAPAAAPAYTFKLDPKAKFHDGHPLTSADVAFSYTLALNQATKSNRLSRLSIIKGAADYSAGKADSVSGIVPLDDQTIRFDMDFPNALFLLETDL